MSKPVLLLLLFLLPPALSLSIGVNYGAVGNNLPPPPQVAAFLKQQTYIDRVKLFDCNPDFIRAFANTGISLMVTAPNGDIPSLARLPAARSWIASNIAPFYPATNISLIAVGNEILATSDRTLIAHLVPAMRSLHAALTEAGMAPAIRVSSPHSLGILSSSDPPTTGRFRKGYAQAIFTPILQFHRDTKTPFVVNPYPYFGYTDRTLDYALFKPNAGVFDPATGVTYTNMFDAQMDAVYSAMKRLGFEDVEIVVGETGWPSVGDPNQPAVTMENAISYNGNLIRHVNSGKGTPLMPNRTFETYIFSLFNENLKPGPTAERNFGLFQPDLTAVYDVGVTRAGAGSTGASPSPSPSPTKPPTGASPSPSSPSPSPITPPTGASPPPPSSSPSPTTPRTGASPSAATPPASKGGCVPKQGVGDSNATCTGNSHKKIIYADVFGLSFSFFEFFIVYIFLFPSI